MSSMQPSMKSTLSIPSTQETFEPEDSTQTAAADLSNSATLSSNDPNMQSAPEEGLEERTDLDDTNIDYLGYLEDG
ncbi:hypothetical protein BDV29DRAFT_161115 [Aspergillus leporis]|uniref:Uncharacterized protein n=1 Tax=Aspergillus leporis TaxID=41062 RepID=A0A5N5WRQ5_9EURO|nr:hypothetical protein BDV29DRAFT_161115 [Aspergillus leporis]